MSLTPYGGDQPFDNRGFGINRRTWNLFNKGSRAAYDVYKQWKGRQPTPSIPRPLRPGTDRVLRALRRKKPMKASIPQGRVMNEGTGGQYSYFSLKPGKSYLPKHVENALPPQVIVSNEAAQLKSSVGLQNIYSAITIMSPALANQYTGDKISRVLYQKGQTDITMNNIFLSNCYMIIYDCIARKDCSSSSVATPLAAWIQGVTDESSSTAYQKLGSTPWQSELFNQYWSVKQVTSVVLGAGATHVHKVRLSPNKIVSGAYSTYTPFALKGLTYYCMVEIHGSPANDTVNQSQVSVGVGGLNIIIDAEETIKQLAKATPTVNIADNSLITSFTTAEQVVNLGGSTIVPQAEG